MSIPFTLPLKTILDYEGRRIRFEGHLGDDLLSFVDIRTNGPFQVEDPITSARGMPTFEWLRREYAEGRLKKPGPIIVSQSKQMREVARLDASACDGIDKRSSWRMRWAIEAHKAGLLRTDEAYQSFIATKQRVIVSEHGYKPPSASSLRRHVRKLEAYGGHCSIFVSQAGRNEGQSHLCEAEDNLLNHVAEMYWASPNWSIRDAEAVMLVQWEELVQFGVRDLSSRCPTYESLRLRIRKLETYDTVAAKFGKELAGRKFDAVGEPVRASRPFERIQMDGTEFEQICVFNDNPDVAASKMVGVICIDTFTRYAFPPVISAGSYREELGIEALTRVMTPPNNLTEEMLQHDECAGWVFGIPGTIVPDNDRTLVPSGYLPSLLELGVEVELPKTYHHDAKAQVESFHKWIKRQLRGLSGTVLSPKARRQVKYDPVKDATMTMHQFRALVDRYFWEYNITPQEILGNRSPFELMKAYMLSKGGPEIDDPDHVRRVLAKTQRDIILTNNGLVFDSIRYRGEAVGQLLADNLAKTPISERLEGTAKCKVQIRTFENDLDRIQVFNPASNEFVTLYSTENEYTAGLSRWEHKQLRKLARAEGAKLQTREQRLRFRARTLEMADELASELPFRRRKVLAALKDSDQVRQMRAKHSGKAMPRASAGSRQAAENGFADLRRKPASPPPGPRLAKSGSELSKSYRVPEGLDVHTKSGDAASTANARDWNEVADEVDDGMDWDD